jgi:hypothetical protein
MFLTTLSVGSWTWHIKFHWNLLHGLWDETYTQSWPARCSLYTQCAKNAYGYSVHSIAFLGSVTCSSQTQAKWFLTFSQLVSHYFKNMSCLHTWPNCGVWHWPDVFHNQYDCLCLIQIFLSMVIGHYASCKFKASRDAKTSETYIMDCTVLWDSGFVKLPAHLCMKSVYCTLDTGK